MTKPNAFTRSLFYFGTRTQWLATTYHISWHALQTTQFAHHHPEWITSERQHTPQDELARIVADQARVIEIVKDLHQQCQQLEEEGSIAYRVLDQSLGHAYTAINRCYPVPTGAIAWLADLKNHNALRAMIACFVPGGRELPSRPPEPVLFRESSGDVVPVNARQIAEFQRSIAEHVKEQYHGNKQLDGYVMLGRSGLVTFSHYHVVQVGNLVIRYALASTTDDHVFDGRVLWIQIVDTEAETVTFCGIGGGTHPITALDGANSALGGVVFNCMHRTFGELLNQLPTGHELTDQVGDLLASVKLSEELQNMREVLACLDQVGQIGARLRALLGPDVVGAPPLEEKEQD